MSETKRCRATRTGAQCILNSAHFDYCEFDRKPELWWDRAMVIRRCPCFLTGSPNLQGNVTVEQCGGKLDHAGKCMWNGGD